MSSSSRKIQRRNERALLKVARRQQCGDCESTVGPIVRGPDGLLRAPMIHEDTCPALRGMTNIPRAHIAVAGEVLPITGRLEKPE